MLLLGAPAAWAQLGITAGVGVGGTNNSLKIKEPPIDPEAGEAAVRDTDALTRVRVGASYLSLGRKSTQRLNYTLSSYYYFQGSEPPGFANEAEYGALINPTRFSEMDLSVRGTQGRTRDLNLFRSQELGMSEARPIVGETFVSGSAEERLRWELGPDWEFGQRLGGEAYTPLGQGRHISPRTLGASAQLALDRVWLRTQAGLFVEAGHGRSTEVVFLEPMQGLTGYPARRANYGQVGLALGHAFSDYWAAHLEGGLMGVQVPQVHDPFLDFGAGLTVTHRTEKRGTFALHAGRSVDTNVYIGDVLLTNTAALRAEYPFGHKEIWNLSADLEYQRSRSLFVVDVKSQFQVYAAAAVLSYAWTRYSRLLFELNFTYQDAEAGLMYRIRSEPFTQHRTMFVASWELRYPEPDDDEHEGGHRLVGRGETSGLDEPEDETSTDGSGGSEESSSTEEGTAPAAQDDASPGHRSRRDQEEGSKTHDRSPGSGPSSPGTRTPSPGTGGTAPGTGAPPPGTGGTTPPPGTGGGNPKPP